MDTASNIVVRNVCIDMIPCVVRAWNWSMRVVGMVQKRKMISFGGKQKFDRKAGLLGSCKAKTTTDLMVGQTLSVSLGYISKTLLA